MRQRVKPSLRSLTSFAELSLERQKRQIYAVSISLPSGSESICISWPEEDKPHTTPRRHALQPAFGRAAANGGKSGPHGKQDRGQRSCLQWPVTGLQKMPSRAQESSR